MLFFSQTASAPSQVSTERFSDVQQPSGSTERSSEEQQSTVSTEQTSFPKSGPTLRRKILRRGRRKAKINNEESMYILGTNAAGILNNLESIEHFVYKFKPGVFFIQESKTKRKNKVKLSDYVVFEHIRNKSGGGGLLTAVHKNLNPVSIGSEDDEEVLTVQSTIMDKKVRFINPYGPQESVTDETKLMFFNKLDEEVKSAKLAGSMICLEMDANSKLGSGLIPGDTNPQSKNGKYLENLLEENNLICVNSTSLCEGITTRYRKTVNRTEKSVLDYFIVCKEFFKLISKMIIDEERKFPLAKYSTTNGQKDVTESDHNISMLLLKIKLRSLHQHSNQRK